MKKDTQPNTCPSLTGGSLMSITLIPTCIQLEYCGYYIKYIIILIFNFSVVNLFIIDERLKIIQVIYFTHPLSTIDTIDTQAAKNKSVYKLKFRIKIKIIFFYQLA